MAALFVYKKVGHSTGPSEVSHARGWVTCGHAPTILIRIEYHSPGQDFLVISIISAYYRRRWISFFDTNFISFFRVFVLDDINIAPYSRSIGLLIKSYTITTALGHIKELDLTRVLPAPWATQNFSDLGADVSKIHLPGMRDDTLTSGPPF